MEVGTVWKPVISDHRKPAYLAIADALAGDLKTGRLRPGDALPTQRALAEILGINVTTVARAYGEAARRGLVEATVGRGTVVRTPAEEDGASLRGRHRELTDRTMNLPPEPVDAGLRARMRGSFEEIGGEIVSLMRYQSVGGSAADKAAALRWLSRRGIESSAETLLIAPGTHSALLAVLGEIARPGETVACETITYPGIRAIAEQLGLRLAGLEEDRDGIDPAALARLARTGAVRTLYLNPTVRNPTTDTMPMQRRAEVVEVARRYGVRIVEDDAYGFLPTDAPTALAMLAPELTFHVSGLAKSLGAGLRLAYLICPEQRMTRNVAGRLKTAAVMASPVTSALASRWIDTGLADDILSAVRAESAARRRIAADVLPAGLTRLDAESFHLWVRLPAGWTRARIVDWMRGQSLGAVASDVFALSEAPPEAFRLCLGGAASRLEARRSLEFLADAFEHPPSRIHDGL
ncbi:GntR family transcriptional regulator [Aureimonas sp. Leaf454]|uniref:aminotransferase-like domain-containing protein n=1 Tax=Aureimonas sp. Leaf454 TaxID=1736381 RepID=UPI0006F7EDDE|nr:PLP-dependent aminotransferase family protein [Aureimonas sp. Leaf454]KQT43036.1 GntR family transcriptional regulator [Aureimonas sp. Leaf454]